MNHRKGDKVEFLLIPYFIFPAHFVLSSLLPAQAQTLAPGGEMIGKYERAAAIPSLEAAKKIADAFEVSLDYLFGEGVNSNFDKKTLKRLKRPGPS